MPTITTTGTVTKSAPGGTTTTTTTTTTTGVNGPAPERLPRRNPTGAKAMLVVDSQADPQGALAAAALPETAVMVYNSAIDSTEDVVSKIEAALKANGGTPLTRIAFANHAGEVWQLASDCICHPGQDGCITDASPVISALAKGLAKEGGRIDLLGCRLLTLDPELPDKLEKEFEGIQFTASDDDTGNRSAGGDWVMESDGIDISADYFDPVKLKVYKDTMATWGWQWSQPVVDHGVITRYDKFFTQIMVGNHSGSCPKVVKLPYADLVVSNRPANPQLPGWTDSFRVEVEGDLLKVFRVDAPNCGWGQSLELKTYAGICDKDWVDLRTQQQDAARTLGYDKRKWDNVRGLPHNHAALHPMLWDELASAEQEAAYVLGYNEQSWDAT